MNFISILLFGLSLLTAALSVVLFAFRLNIKRLDLFFFFYPALFLYLSFISLGLSFFNQLNSTSLLSTQLIIFIPLIMGLKKNKFCFYFKNLFQKKHKKLRFFHIDSVSVVLSFLLVLILATSFLLRLYQPLTDFDDKRYRATAPLQWAQNQSIFRYQTPDERENLIVIGSGLIYMWPSIFHVNETVSNAFYWMAFPLCALGIFLFSGTFTKNNKFKILSALFFVSAPIIMRYFSYTLTQESWLGLILLCFGYFLIKNQIKADRKIIYPILVGVSLGICTLIKPNAWIYALILASYFFYKKVELINVKYVITAIILCLVFSGYFILSFQDFLIYNSFKNQNHFYNKDIAPLSPEQIQTRLIRSSLLFFDPPLFLQGPTRTTESFVQHLSQKLGATKILEEELEISWFGKYKYSLSSPNTRFSLGGIAWVVFFLGGIFLLFKKPKENINKIFLIFCVSVVLQLLFLRWEQNSEIPDRHLMSSFALATSFFSFYFEKIYSAYKKRRLLLYAMLIITVFAAIQIFLQYAQTANAWVIRDSKTNSSIHNRLLTFPYHDFMGTLNHSTSFLLAESSVALYYPLFLYQGTNYNKVYLVDNRFLSNTEEFAEKIISETLIKNPEYVILYYQKERLLTDLINSRGGKIFLLEYKIPRPSNYTITILRNKLHKKEK